MKLLLRLQDIDLAKPLGAKLLTSHKGNRLAIKEKEDLFFFDQKLKQLSIVSM